MRWKAINITFLCLAVWSTGMTQQQDWVRYGFRQSRYPDKTHFKGFVSYYLVKDTDLNALQENLTERAKIQLSENIRVSLSSQITNTMTNVNGTSVEEFRKVSTSYAQVDLPGIKTDFYIDQRKKEAYAFARVRKEEVISFYTTELELAISKLKAISKTGNKSEEESDPSLALMRFNEISPAVRKVEEIQAVLIACGVRDRGILQIDAVSEIRSRTLEQLGEARKNTKMNLGLMSAFLAQSLVEQSLNKEVPVVMGGISYKDSQMASALSERLKALVALELNRNGYQLMAYQDPTQQGEGSFYQLRGTYWEDGSGSIQVILNVYEAGAGPKLLVASSEAWTTIELLDQANVSHFPSNYLQASEKQEMLEQGKVVNGGMEVELWTNKGVDSPVFKEGEKLSISVRVNRPGYLRLLNYWADGTQLLLLDNYYINQERVNKTFDIPFEWVCACPCGVEFLQAIVQSKEFDPLLVKPMGQFKVIQETLPTTVEKSRAFRGFLDAGDAYMGETKLTLTTLK